MHVQWVAKYGTSLHLKFAFFLWLFFNGGETFGESNNIKSFQIWWISETKRLVSTLRLWPPISSPQIRQDRVNIELLFLRVGTEDLNKDGFERSRQEGDGVGAF